MINSGHECDFQSPTSTSSQWFSLCSIHYKKQPQKGDKLKRTVVGRIMISPKHLYPNPAEFVTMTGSWERGIKVANASRFLTC